MERGGHTKNSKSRHCQDWFDPPPSILAMADLTTKARKYDSQQFDNKCALITIFGSEWLLLGKMFISCGWMIYFGDKAWSIRRNDNAYHKYIRTCHWENATLIIGTSLSKCRQWCQICWCQWCNNDSNDDAVFPSRPSKDGFARLTGIWGKTPV